MINKDVQWQDGEAMTAEDIKFSFDYYKVHPPITDDLALGQKDYIKEIKVIDDQTINILGGAILVENVFNYPGLGQLMREAVTVRDYVLIQGMFLIVAFLVLSVNLLADVFYKRIDPRVR